MQHLRQCGELVRERRAGVVPHAVSWRVETCEQRRVRWQRERHRGEGFLEQGALSRDPVERRRQNARESVGRQAIGSHRIERDQQEIPRARHGNRGRAGQLQQQRCGETERNSAAPEHDR